ncbi:MAG: hypothetical protein AB7J30_08105 [Hyphomicrobium sp.]|uniref:hypothetical protein n=1 Tax=Hyphomicrobium sp. TaxID=82 RepID=UPI003D0B30A0
MTGRLGGETMIASDPNRSDRRAAYTARRESAAREKPEAWKIGLTKSLERDRALGCELIIRWSIDEPRQAKGQENREARCLRIGQAV